MTLEDLPLEIIHHILYYTDPRSFGSVSAVSKFWQAVFEDDEVWHTMNAMFFGNPTQVYFDFKDLLIRNYTTMLRTGSDDEMLIWAVRKGFHMAVRNYRDPETKCQSLYLASSEGFIDVVRELLHFKANLEEGNEMLETPLLIAARLGYANIVEVLIQHQANVNARDKYSRSALHKAAYLGQTASIASLLRDPRIKVELVESSYKQTALHIACGRNHLDIVILLLQSMANINAVDRDGWTPLHIACYKGNKEVVEALLGHGHADREALVEHQWTALSFAERQGFLDIAALFSSVA